MWTKSIGLATPGVYRELKLNSLSEGSCTWLMKQNVANSFYIHDFLILHDLYGYSIGVRL